METKLFVIGNGFDLGHYYEHEFWEDGTHKSLPTRYKDFREYLYYNHPDFLNKMENAYGSSYYSGEDYQNPGYYENPKIVVDDKWWKDFEYNLGDADLFESDFRDAAKSIIDGMKDDDGESMPDIEDTLREAFKDYYDFMEELKELAAEWIKTVNLEDVERRTKFITDIDSLYLTFNYTKVLEKVYGIPSENICHIHGSVDLYKVVIGHGNNEKIEYHRNRYYELKDLDKNEAEIESAFEEFYDASLKDTSSIIIDHADVFASYKGVKEVHLVGLSLGDVDKPYFKEIKRVIRPDADWYCYYHCPDKNQVPQEVKDKRDKLSFLDLDEDKLHIVDADKFWKL
ncbi:bacteriophage abortive infection AbiH family protein [Butyrivibrio sp. FC2001]|uniref:bacteriophage abortive infection AbiH family protein n=1 Tax=Butyrivibrio sp. FC2001 TaxID=1280671 RepID=UPI0004169B4A|nr:bacteriophage abortive infection AbiH family protein [Butyrivibrio sp. FC2001]